MKKIIIFSVAILFLGLIVLMLPWSSSGQGTKGTLPDGAVAMVSF